MKFGKRAYEAWVNATYWDSKRATKWEMLPRSIQMSWAAVAGAVIEEYQNGEQPSSVGNSDIHN